MIGMKIIDRETAKAKGLVRYFTGEPCKRGHVAERQTTNTACIVCRLETSKRDYDTNRTMRLAQKRKAYADDPDKFAQRNRNFYARNSEEFSERNRAYYLKNVDVFVAREAERRARRLQATPKWLSKKHRDWMTALYAIARLRSRIEGVEYHVDHIVPLKGRNVCGLHVPWNLRIILATDNLSKSNKFEG